MESFCGGFDFSESPFVDLRINNNNPITLQSAWRHIEGHHHVLPFLSTISDKWYFLITVKLRFSAYLHFSYRISL